LNIRLCLLLLSMPLLAGAGGAPIEILRNGKVVAQPHGPALQANLVRLLASCDVESTGYAVKPSTWAELKRSPWRVHLNLVTPTPELSRAGPLWASDILVLLRPDTYPGHVYVKLGDTVRSFTKYQPDVLVALSKDPALQLAGSRVYDDLERSVRTHR
jgi:hypothetical protein